MPKPPKELEKFESLLKVVEDLRGPNGCPWDKEQTHSSLTRFAIEEAHELAEAIDHGDQSDLVEELGDLLLQVVLHSEIARQENRFNISDVIESLNSKMIRRHPHVFSDTKVEGTEDVLNNWKKIKEKEKASKPKTSFDIPKQIPALIYSHKIGEKTERSGFDWNSAEEVILKVEEELKELKDAMVGRDQEALKHELGDLLFSTVQVGRHLNLDSEQCLRTTNQRFENRYFKMLELCRKRGVDFEALSADAKEKLWQEVKGSMS